MKQVKILTINQLNINEENEVYNLDDINIVKVGTYNFLIKSLEIYRENEFEDGEQIVEYIKVMLPSNEEKAQEQWTNGIMWEGKLYKAWFATVGGMKQQDMASKSKCEVIFVNEKAVAFTVWFEDLISLGKFSKIDKTKDIYVNKTILSRLSLATSELITEIDMPNIIILPQKKLDWKRTYKTVETIDVKNIDKDGNEKTSLDYNLIDYNFDTNKSDKDGNAIDVMDIFDGGGVASPKVMDLIGRKLLPIRTDIDFAIIRGFGIAIKGMVTRFDIIAYLEENYKADTEFCKKVNGKFELKDMYGDFQVVTDNTLLINESMVKLANIFDNMKEYNELLGTYGGIRKDLLNKLYITKVNKKNDKLEQYRRMNYQFINGLALTSGEYNILAEQDFKLFKKILKPFEKGKKEEFITNADYINLFYNQCCESERDANNIKEIVSVVDKSNTLININQENVKLSYVKKSLARLVEKKIRDMAKGRITLKSTYNYIAVDPISYMNFAMTRDLGINGLAKGEFYCRSIEDGDWRTIFRNPCMAYSEIHNVNFVRSIFLDRWLCQSEEIVYFNDKSDILNLMGSADKDGDSCTMVDNGIVRNAVVIPADGKYFISLADGKKVPCKFDLEGRFKATYTPSGNLIGKVAIMGASVNNASQQCKTYYNPTSDIFFSYEEVKEVLIKENIIDIKGKNDEEQYEIIKECIKKELIEKGIFIYSSTLDKEVIRKQMRQQFYENERDIYSLLYVSSLVIDSPKTMNVIDVAEYTRGLQAKYNKKANFLQYDKRLNEVKEEDYAYTINSVLDNFGEKVQKELLDTIINFRKIFGDHPELLQKQLINKNYIYEKMKKAYSLLADMYNAYVKKIHGIEREQINFKNEIKHKEAIHHQKHDRVSSKWEEIDWKKDLEKIHELYKINRNKYYKGLDAIDAEFTLVANEIIENNDIHSVAMALGTTKKVTERFIINFFMSALIAVDQINPSAKSEYYKCDDSEPNKIEYMYYAYKKEERPISFSDAVIEKLEMNDLVRYKLAAEVRFRNEDAQLIVNIKNGIDIKGYYDLDITKLEVFEDFKKEVVDKTIVRVKGFMSKTDGTKHITKKSFGVCIER